MRTLALLAAVLLAGCAGIPEGVSAIRGFELNRYLGTWYEIARLDHSFERGLIRVTAAYSLREDGGVKVINRGFDPLKQEWREAIGKAYFVEGPDIGRLKVSFFGPFYGGYNIVDLDRENYSYSLVSGPTRSYLWILARNKKLEPATLKRLVDKAKALGFATDKLIYVDQSDK
ncbi:lipocalin family protein [Methylocaldum sp.]|uniref:lipocalin family protein n=1 Tax=Methylocaldum sp. TaxID=1969727 RepID=UPI002D589F0E|nr:lipocalin family protein [Methylocaldum sp.]HYE34771.1 lipocalin family protein [Methylocaldum sp.]